MKTLTKVILTLCITSAVCSCNRVPDISGTWNGTASQIGYTGKDNVTGPLVNGQITNTLTFIPSVNETRMGTVEIASVINVTDAVPFEGQVTDPYEINVTATATGRGAYHFTDDDELVIAIDNNSINVNVDPEAVTYAENVFTGTQSPQTEDIKGKLASAYKAKILSQIRLEYSKMQRLDDIKVHDNILSCEFADRDYTFRRN